MKSHIVEIRMLCHKCPLCIVQSVVEVSDSNLDSPIILVIDLNVPMHAYWAHVVVALQQWLIILSWSVYSLLFQFLGVALAPSESQ